MVILVLMKLQIVGKKKFQKTEIVETFVGKVMMTNRSNIIVIRDKITTSSTIKHFRPIVSFYLIQMLIEIVEFNLLKKIIIFINTV